MHRARRTVIMVVLVAVFFALKSHFNFAILKPVISFSDSQTCVKWINGLEKERICHYCLFE